MLGVEVARALQAAVHPTFLPRAGKPVAAGRGEPRVERFDEEMRLRGYAFRTRKAYLGHTRRFLQEVGEGTDPGRWLLPGARPGRHLSARSVQDVTAGSTSA